MAEVVLNDPWDLTPAEQTKLDRLLKLYEEGKVKEFDSQVRLMVTDPEPLESDQFVLQHPEIAELTLASLTRLIGAAQRALQVQRGAGVKKFLHDELKQLGRARRTVRPHVNLAIAQTARGDDNRLAEKVLRRVYYPEYKAVLRDIEAGMSAKDAEAAAKARRAGGIVEGHRSALPG